MNRRLLVALGIAIATALPCGAADKTDEKKPDPPKICCADVAALIAGTTKSVKLRGLTLAEATAVKADVAGVEVPATLKSKGKSDAPKPYDTPRAGDSEAQVEFKLPADLKGDAIAVTLTTPAGNTPAFSIPVRGPGVTFEEKEPNGGFKNAQELPLGKSALGRIGEKNDVDVYRIGGRAGMRIAAEVFADRRGSLLDATLTLYDAAGHILATADDSADSRDPVLRATLPADGVYYLSLIDANENGGSSHAYELTWREEK